MLVHCDFQFLRVCINLPLLNDYWNSTALVKYTLNFIPSTQMKTCGGASLKADRGRTSSLLSETFHLLPPAAPTRSETSSGFNLNLYREGQLTEGARPDKNRDNSGWWKWRHCAFSSLFSTTGNRGRRKEMISSFQQKSNMVNSMCVIQINEV